MSNEQPITFALVCRLQFCEVPFLNEYIDYYTKLGVNHFYFVNSEPQNLERIKSHIARQFLNVITLINKETRVSIRKSQNQALNFINETFTLHVDLDEFLYLNGNDLSQFIAKYMNKPDGSCYSAFQFHWVMSPCYKHLYKTSIKEILSDNYFFPSREVKTMALTSEIDEILDHTMKYKSNIATKRMTVEHDNLFIFHVSARGIYDAINKLLYHQLSHVKKSKDPATELNDLIFSHNSERLPNRFIALAFQSRFQNHVVSLSYRFPDLDYVTETGLLEKIAMDGLKNLLKRDVTKQDICQIISKIENFSIPANLVNQYAASEINLLYAITALEDDASTWWEKTSKQIRDMLKQLLRS